MVSNVLAAAAVVRRDVRRVGSMELLGLLSAVGLVPLALYLPRSDGTRYLLLSLVCLYAGRKIIQFLNARSALRQLSMEEHFLRYGSSGARVQKCVRNDDHMWAKSRIVAGLKSVCAWRVPGQLLAEERRHRVYRCYRTAFRSMLPRIAVIDVGLVGAAGLTMLLAPTIAVRAGAVVLQAGFLALALAAAVEISRWLVNRRLQEGFDRWFGALSDWTLRAGLDSLSVRSGAYSHRLLYFTQPWFADGSEEDAEHDQMLHVGSKDDPVIPTNLPRDVPGEDA